jgi:hypothetical protein
MDNNNKLRLNMTDIVERPRPTKEDLMSAMQDGTLICIMWNDGSKTCVKSGNTESWAIPVLDAWVEDGGVITIV